MTEPDFLSDTVWREINRRMIAKALSELAYEELLAPKVLERGRDQVHCALQLASGAQYEFEGRRTIWGEVAVYPQTVRRTRSQQNGVDESDAEMDAAQFVLDAQVELGTTPATLAGLLREINQTLLADAWLFCRLRGLTAADLSQLPFDQRQARLSGHPKMLANKGRIGWGRNDVERYAPEFAEPFRLHWLAADRRVAVVACDADVSEDDVLTACLPAEDREALGRQMWREGVAAEKYVVFPVHPWQWDSVVVSQYAGELAARRLVWLGQFGDRYRPQLGIRTLANVDRPHCYDLKLALSIINTSVYRGIKDTWVRAAPELSRWLRGIVSRDSELSGRVEVLAEQVGVHYPNPSYANLPDAPYHYQEQLGAIWRRSADSVLGEAEQAVLLAAFGEYDGFGHTLVSDYLRQSRLPAVEWLTRLFDTVTVPLYHLLCKYGFCPIPHGQNVVVILRNGIPIRYALKDFHGDLVLDDLPIREGLPDWVAAMVPREPDEMIVQNILTAHIATTLRFVSRALTHIGLSEEEFYQTLGSCVRRYQDAHPELAHRFTRYDLFTPSMARYCLNRLRLAIGYGDQTQRPPKIFGTPLINPLALTDPRRGMQSAFTPPASQSPPHTDGHHDH